MDKLPFDCKYSSFFLLILFLVVSVQCHAQYRPSLLFREDWKESPPATPITQEHVANPALILNLYGPGADSLKKSHHDQPADDPYYIWSGLCLGNWAVTLKDRNLRADLSDHARIIWRSKQAGLHALHVVLKLVDGTWLVSAEGDGPSGDWRIREFILADMTWYLLDIVTLTEGEKVCNPDLARVDEIGFTDLMRGGQSVACSRLDWIEVYGWRVNSEK